MARESQIIMSWGKIYTEGEDGNSNWAIDRGIEGDVMVESQVKDVTIDKSGDHNNASNHCHHIDASRVLNLEDPGSFRFLHTCWTVVNPFELEEYKHIPVLKNSTQTSTVNPCVIRTKRVAFIA